jgi:hypothetical protein
VSAVSGFRAKFLTAVLSTLPRRLRVRVLSAVVRNWQMAKPYATGALSRDSGRLRLKPIAYNGI